MKDTIYRQDAIDALKKEQAHYAHEDGAEIFYEYSHAIKALKNLPSAQPVAKDINVPNNDTISRAAAIDEIDEWIKAFRENGHKESAADACLIQDGIIQLPSAQPEIIHCRKCKFASGDSRICMKFGHSPIGELDFCAWAERREE